MLSPYQIGFAFDVPIKVEVWDLTEVAYNMRFCPAIYQPSNTLRKHTSKVINSLLSLFQEEKTEEDEVYTASRQLVCEWAHKLLGTNFNNLRELAEFLVGNLYVNSKSTAAFTVLAAMQDAGLHNSKGKIVSQHAQ